MLVFPFYLPCMNRSHIQMMYMGKCAKYLNKLSQLFCGKVNECAHFSKRYKSYISYWYTSYCCLCRTIESCWLVGWLVGWLYITPAFIWPKYCLDGVNHYTINQSINQDPQYRVIWLNYYRYGVKHYITNQSINQSINQAPPSTALYCWTITDTA